MLNLLVFICLVECQPQEKEDEVVVETIEWRFFDKHREISVE